MLVQQSYTLKSDYAIYDLFKRDYVELDHKKYYSSRSGNTVALNFLGNLKPYHILFDCQNNNNYSDTKIESNGTLWNVGIKQNGRNAEPVLFFYYWQDSSTVFIHETEAEYSSFPPPFLNEDGYIDREVWVERTEWKADKTRSYAYKIQVFVSKNKYMPYGRNSHVGFESTGFKNIWTTEKDGNFLFIESHRVMAARLHKKFNPYTFVGDCDLKAITDYYEEINEPLHTLNSNFLLSLANGMSLKKAFAKVTFQMHLEVDGMDLWIRKSRNAYIAQYYYTKGNRTWEYEAEFENVLKFANPSELLKECREGAINKAIEDIKREKYNKISHLSMLELLEKLEGQMLTKSDSVAAGNCEYGTQKFLEQYDLPEDIEVSDLINHKNFNKFSTNSQFRRVVEHKLIGFSSYSSNRRGGNRVNRDY